MWAQVRGSHPVVLCLGLCHTRQLEDLSPPQPNPLPSSRAQGNLSFSTSVISLPLGSSALTPLVLHCPGRVFHILPSPSQLPIHPEGMKAQKIKIYLSSCLQRCIIKRVNLPLKIIKCIVNMREKQKGIWAIYMAEVTEINEG